MANSHFTLRSQCTGADSSPKDLAWKVAFSAGLIGASIAPGYPDTRAAYDWLRSSANCPNVANSVSLRLSVTGRKGSVVAFQLVLLQARSEHSLTTLLVMPRISQELIRAPSRYHCRKASMAGAFAINGAHRPWWTSRASSRP